MRFIFLLAFSALICINPVLISAKEKWTPGSPVPDEVPVYDWIQVNNSEWLKGKFISLRNGELKFDSSEFDEQTLDWDNVTEFHSSGKVEVVLYDRSIITDRISVIQDKVVLHEEGRILERYKILSIIPYENSWWSMWEGDASVNFNLRKGNSNLFDLLMHLSLVNRTAFTRTNVDYKGNISKTETILTADNHRFSTGMDVFISPRVFLTPLTYEFINNQFQNIQQQHTPTTGAGYEIFDYEKIEWDVSGSLGYQYLQYYSVQAGQQPFTQGIIVKLGTLFHWEISDTADFDLDYTFQMDILDASNMLHYLFSEISVDITEQLDLLLAFSWNRVQNPEPRSDGSLPSKDDFSVSAGVGIEF